MPIINVQIAKGRTEATKQELAERLTAVASEVLGVEKDWVTVLITEYDRGNWASGGTLHSLKFGPGHGRAGTES